MPSRRCRPGAIGGGRGRAAGRWPNLTALLVEKSTREKDGQLLWPMVGVPHFPKPRAQLQTSEQKHEQTHRALKTVFSDSTFQSYILFQISSFLLLTL